ncbi:MAG: leucine-rich repeat protein [Bacteroidaceae bacterium]|nr:leucine-rich repeat protein [Bacteroidaceae bacterium]
MKKKLLKFLCTALLAVTGMSANAQTSGSCGDNATWEYESTTLTISGTGAMADYAYGEAPWAAFAETMTSLVIEEGITSIGNNAFAGCENLNSVTYPASGFTSIGDYAFSGAKVKSPNLPRTLTHLGTGAFSGSQAKYVSIPASLKTISDFAFESCANLESVGIFDGVEEIGESAFDGCAFTVITIPGTVKTIGGGAFMSNTALESVYIGAGVKTIGDAAFQGCTGLKEIGIGGKSKPALGEAVFTEDDGTTLLDIEAFYVPYGVNYDGWGGFDSETFKTEMLGTWTNSDDPSLGSGNWRFDILEGKLTVSGTGKLNVAPWNDEPAINPIVYQDYEHPGFWGGIKSAVFLSGITSLENMACGMQINCASVTLPNTLKTITNSALEECAFTSIDLPEGLETIDMYAFFGSKLTSLVIPSTVTKLGYSVFLYNENLEVVTLLPATPPTLEAELPFGECEALTAIYVPAGCAAAYQAAWPDYADLIKDAPNTTFTYTASEKVTKFDNYANFKGAMSVKSHEYDEGTQTGTVVYEGYVTTIGEMALTYTKLTSITIPECVTVIDTYSFQGSKQLTTVNFAGTPALTTIGARAFNSCSALTAFTVPATVTSIGASAFAYCSELTTFTFAGTPTITSIGNTAFSDCKKLTSFTIPESVTTLGTTVFWYAGLTSLNIPAGVTSIGQALFCSSPVTTVTVAAGNAKYADLGCNGIFEKASNRLVAGGAATTIPDGITTIGEEAFWGEEGTFALTLPESVTTIESRAFHMTSGLTSVNIPSGVTHIDKETFFFVEIQDLYCYASPAITWDGGMKDDFSLMNPKSTKFHVAAADLEAWETNFPEANVTFVGDLGAPTIALTLDETTDNSATIAAKDGVTCDVTLKRTLHAGSYNTFAVPFDVDAATLTAKGIIAKQLTASFLDGTTLTLSFTDATNLKAGKPYLVKVAADMENPTFQGVTISDDLTATVTDFMDLYPTTGKTNISIASDAVQVLFLGAENTLHPTAQPADIKGFRAYFVLHDEAVGVRSFRLDLGEDETLTAIAGMENGKWTMDNEVYDLSGRRLSNINYPKKGAYIHNGKVIIK